MIQSFEFVHDLGIFLRRPDELRIGPGEGHFAGGLNQDSEHEIGKIITCCALDRPVLAKAFMTRQNFFDNAVKFGHLRFFPQPHEIPTGIK